MALFKNTPRKSKGEILAALDVGSSKIVCFIARRDEDDQLRIVGIGHNLASGIKGGMITDMEQAERAIRTAVSSAEDMAGEQIERVHVNISGGHIHSRTAHLELPLHGREVTDHDIDRILAQSEDLTAEATDGMPQEIIHTIPVGYSIDGQRGIHDPRGMIGTALGAHLHVISAAYGPARTLAAAVARCHLDVAQMAVSAYASGLACLVEDEMNLGSTIIDMGAGTTSFAVFFDGTCVFTDSVPLGGAHVTNDIARGLTTSLHHAERLKTLYGNALPSSADEREMIDIPQVGEEAPELASRLPKTALTNIIRPRLEEIFELVRGRLQASGFQETAGRRLVLTGGASQMPGIREMAQRLLDKQVRLGRPLRIGRAANGNSNASLSNHGLLDYATGPGFATAAGLLAVAMAPSLTVPRFDLDRGASWWERAQAWLRQNG